METSSLWIVFWGTVGTLLVLDLAVFHRKTHRIELKEALCWTGVWVGLALVLNAIIYFEMENGPQRAVEFLTCYLTEEALSVDNLFVFLVIFRFMAVPAESQHRVLFWGILGALVLRGLFIWTGVELIERFHWTVYVLGAFLVLTGIKLALLKDAEVHPERNIILRLTRRFLPVTSEYHGSQFVVRRDGRMLATPLLVALLVVETTDVMFAVDSVPAALAISSDRFVLYSSNMMAVMGLRSLYFAIAGVMDLFRYLHYGLALILVFVGAKMLLRGHYDIPMGVALGVVAGILTLSIVVSLWERSVRSRSSRQRSSER